LLNNLVNSAIRKLKRKDMEEQKALRKQFFGGIAIPSAS